MADNAPTDLDGATTVSGTNNLVKIPGANLTLPAGTLSADPMLGPLAFNGGTMRTHALDTGSPAIDAGNNNVLNLESDQRGVPYPRAIGMHADIGAVEFDSHHIFADAFGQ